MEIAPGISVDEYIRFGKPVISGTRIPVDLIIGKLAGGMTYEEVMVDKKKLKLINVIQEPHFHFYKNKNNIFLKGRRL